MSKNSYRKALRHIKSKKIDERLELLSEIPTNATSGVYVDTPGQFVQDPDVDNPQFSDHPLDLSQDDSSTDTTGLFLSDGTILSAIPPGDNSYVLGPMMSMNYSWGNFTQIGYVRQSDRKMVNLARITGTIEAWDGESGFTSYGQLTLEQAQWFKDQSRSTYFAFYPGPPSDGSDVSGRYEGQIINSRRTYGTRTPDPRYVNSGSNRSGDPSDNYSAQSDKDKSVDPKSYPTDPEERAQMSASELAELGINLLNIGLDIAAIAAIIFPEPGTSAVGLARIATRLGLRAGSTALKASRAARTTQALNQGVRAARVNPAQRVRNSAKNSKLKDWWNRGRNQRVPDENNASWRDLVRDDRAQIGRFVDPKNPVNPDGTPRLTGGAFPDLRKGYQVRQFVTGQGGATRSFNPFLGPGKGLRSGPTPLARQQVERPVRSIGRAVRRLKKEDGPKKFSDFHNELLLMEENLLLEQEAAAETAAPSNGIQANSGNITPEQEQKVNATADEFADEVAKELSDEEAAEAAVDAESDVAQQEAEATFLSEDPVEAFNQLIDIIDEYDMTLDDITSDDMDRLFSIGDQLAILNGTDPGTQVKFLEILGISPTMLSNFTDNSYSEFDNWQKNGWRWWYLKPGGTPTTGWDGKFYMYDDPLLEVSRIVSFDEYQKAKERPNFYGLETPAVAGPGRRYKVTPPRYKGGRETYQLAGVTQFNANAVDDARRILGTGRLGGRSGLGLNWEYSLYKGEIDSQLTGYAGAAFDAVAIATQYLEHVIKTNLVSDIVANRISDIQRYPGIYEKAGRPNLLTDETWNVYDFSWNKVAESMDWVFSLNSNNILSPESAYGSSGRYASAKRDADRLWKRWESVKEFGLSLKELDWESYDNDKWYGDGEFSKTHPLIGMTSPEPEGPRDGYNYYPEFDDIEDVPSRITAEDVKPTIDDLGAAGFAAYKAGGGDAKVKQGLTVAEVIAQGKINLAALYPGSPLQKPIQNPEQNSPNLFKGVVELVGQLMIQTGSPLDLRGGPSEVFRVQTQIAKSILQNEPIRSTAASGYEIRSVMEVIEKDAMNVDALQALGRTDPTMTTLNGVVIVDEPRNYSDDHIYEDDNGVVRTHTNQTRKRYPSTVGSIPGRNAEGIAVRPIAERGEAQLEIVVPRDGSEPYLRYLDHAYLNVNYAPGEVAQGWQEWIAKQVVNLRDFVQGGKGHTGAFKNYPDFIKGDERLEFTVPYNQMSESLKRIIDRYRQTRTGTGPLSTTDAAVAAAERARREEEERRKRERRRGQGGRSLGDTTDRGGMQESKEVLTKSHKRILREIKKPYELPETPTKFKVSPKVIGSKNKIVGADMMREQEIQKSFKTKPDDIWGKEEYAANVRASQEKKNTVLELVGAAEHHWTTLTEKSQREKQEKINEMMAAEHDKEMKIMYEKYQKNQNKVDKIRTHYQGKPSPEGYPIKPPPETVDGYHPKYGKNYKYDKLDPHSAESMPKTDDQEIDANIDKATDHEKKDRKLKNLIGKVRKG